ncbi:hypothetical protein H2200_005938 [Cladophialophora chaetospira]|uniref:Glutathione S-transferase n=1 Tax=Cladophialophora chaetospira TaxID=386627 RepID=A0AA38XAK3_9EURO|nr:hypothetical protein H2200_005938 [Cladophialophora chaetospira]
MSKALLLHAHSSSPNPIKVSIALQYLQVPYDVQVWEFGNDPKNGIEGPAFSKLTPVGRLPVLEDPNTGVTIWESGAIISYLKRQYDPQKILGPKDASLQSAADIEMWELLLLTAIGPMTGQMAWFKFYEPPPTNEPAIARYKGQVHRYYDVLERQLAKSGGQSILAGGITSVDVHCEPWLQRPQFIGISLERYPNIRHWLKVMSEQKAFQDGYQKVKDATQRPDRFSEDRGVNPWKEV